MKNKNKNKRKKTIFIFYVIGNILLLLSIIFYETKVLPLIIIELVAIIAFLLSLPESIYFIKDKMNKDEGTSMFWICKFFALPLCLLGLIIAFIIELRKLF